MQYLTILGSTGFIGRAALTVVQEHIDKFSVYALVAKSNVSVMTEQCLLFNPRYACMISKNAAAILKTNLNFSHKCNTQVLSGVDNACMLAGSDDVDVVISAIVGIAGLRPTFSALYAGKKILLANKESLVVCGKFFMKEAKRYRAFILPIDSEHNAIFQSLPISLQNDLGCASLSEHGVMQIVLTASGGIFSKIPLNELKNITPQQACMHPNWVMGRKTSIDSATMMNKGLEYIEACHLFNASCDEIKVLLHPQSLVHSMVHYNDGNTLIHFAIPDMKIPIAYAMAYPNRIKLNSVSEKFFSIDYFNKLHFSNLNIEYYPCMKLALTAYNCSQAAVIILNAANEIAVDAFLKRIISFVEIPNLIDRVLDSVDLNNPNNVEDIFYIDQKARDAAIQYLKILYKGK